MHKVLVMSLTNEPTSTILNLRTPPTRAPAFIPMNLGIPGDPQTVGKDDSEAGTCPHLRVRHLHPSIVTKDLEQTIRAARTVPAPPRSTRAAPSAVLPGNRERYVNRRVAAKTTLHHNTASSSWR